jgi:hypothetical protein
VSVPISPLLAPTTTTTTTTTTTHNDLSIYAFGDSQGEVLDYVFQNDDRYQTWSDPRVGWRSGWSARGLYLEANLQKILKPLSECTTTHALVFLTFGATDIDINLSYKRHQKQETVDLPSFLDQMTTNTYGLIQRLRRMNEDPAVGCEIHVW